MGKIALAKTELVTKWKCLRQPGVACLPPPLLRNDYDDAAAAKNDGKP
jgi:hypothetical protein